MLPQLLFIIGAIISIPFIPILIFQGKSVRDGVPRLPEAQGEKVGVSGNFRETIRLLMLGESTFAGVGVRDHREGITGQAADALSSLSQKSVRWHVLANSGYTARRVADRLAPHIPVAPVDIIVIGLGGNDTFRLHSPRRWKRDLGRLIDEIRQKQPHSPVVIANMPPIGQFPAFSKLMRFFLGNLVKLHGMAAGQLAGERANVYFMNHPIIFGEWAARASGPVRVSDFFSDGIHPSALTYALWAREIAEYIVHMKLIDPADKPQATRA